VRVNGKEVARWDFTPEKLPESARFTREVRVKIEGDTEITAQGSCNKHGSKGQATLRIRAK
jgi:desulfoferrodoxin (superoxide reductase-like protein)